MKVNRLTHWLLLLLLLGLVACGGGATEEPEATDAADTGDTAEPTDAPADTGDDTGGFQIPDIEEGKTNVAMVLIGPHDDGGWSEAHYDGLLYVEENVANTHVAYIELVPEGADSEQVFRSLARKGFDLIIGTSFGYMDPMEIVAGDFPDSTFIHLTGYKSNGDNFGNLFGAMEVYKYMAGMLAGSRAKVDGNPRIGYMATFPIPEELRLGNAIALGMKRTCPECTMDVRWINTWHDPVIEREAAASLFDAGAQVVFTGADTPAAGEVATEKGKWGVNYDHFSACSQERCLTAPYWVWGPIYARITEAVADGTYTAGYEYFDADAGAMGLYGFEEGQTPSAGIADLPEEDVAMVREILEAARNGDFTRFDVFAGPIMNNQGGVVVPEGERMVQADLDQFPPGAPGLECTYCMFWWADGITAELPES